MHKLLCAAALALLATGSSPGGAAIAPGSEMARWQARAARVTIVRDNLGIAHVRGRTDADAVFGMIVAQAEDDFNRVETNYLTALGRRAEADGPALLWQDLRQRLFLDPEALKREYAESPAWLKALMDAWADGLNFYLASHPEVRPRVITRFEPWMTLAFSEGSIGGDIERAVALPDLQAFYAGRRSALAQAPRAGKLIEPQGSNGIAIGPSRAAGKHVLLWINPHTSFFFRSELQVTSDEGLNAYGAATWGQFFIYQGFNRHVGWMHTSSGVDNIDEFAETIVRRGDELSYRYGRELRPVKSRRVTIGVRDDRGMLRERRFDVLSTHHGPIIRGEGDRWVSVGLLNSPRQALEQSFLRTKARSFSEYLQVAERKANSSNNTIFADDKGTIAYLHPQFVPIRDNRFDYTRTVDGSDPRTDWRGLHRLDELPRVVNPGVGWVVNTNNWPWSAAGRDSPQAADFPRYMDQDGENPRGIHALQLLDNDRKFTPEALRAAAFDTFLPLFDEQIPKLQQAYERLPRNDPRRARLAAPLKLLTGWDRRWSVQSRPTALAVFWGEALWASEGPKAQAAHMTMFRYLAERTTGEDRLAGLDRAVARLRADFGDWRVAWGRINRFQRLNGDIEQAFDDKAPSIAVGFTTGNFGSLAAFSATRHPGTRCFYGTSGNSFVALVEFGSRIRAWAVSAGGESGDPRSPHFDDQSRLYASGNLRPILFYPEDLKPFAARAYHPGSRPTQLPRRSAPPATSRCGAL